MRLVQASRAIGIALFALACAPAPGQNCAPIQLNTVPPGAGDGFGSSGAASTDTIVFGAPGKAVGPNAFQGQASIYRFVSAAWSLEGTLTALDGSANDQFGASIAISGETVIVGAPGKTIGGGSFQGAAYVFTRSGSTWTQQARLTASDGAIGDSFGCSVAVFGDTAVVGAYAKSGPGGFNQGAAYVFTRSGSVWTQQAKLLATDGAGNDFLGISVSAGLDAAAIGASNKTVSGNLAQGAAYIFTRSGSVWTQQAKLVASDGGTNDALGASISISGSSVLVGAKYKAVGPNEYQGAGYVFTRSGSVWTQQAKLVASDGGAFDYLGSACILSGDTAVLGAPNQFVAPNAGQGAGYVFARSGTTWMQQSKLLSTTPQAGESFGSSVALAGGASVGGAPHRTVGASAGQGAAFVFGSNIPINIIQQPASLTTCTLNAASFPLTAAGTGPFSYQWQWRAVPAVPTWIPVASGTNSGGGRTFSASGASASTLSIQWFEQSGSSQPFVEVRCIVSNSCGSATSTAAQLRVCWSDLNCDGQVDDLDFVQFASAYNLLECSDPAMPLRCPSDLNFDALVDDVDFAVFAQAYDTLTCP